MATRQVAVMVRCGLQLVRLLDSYRRTRRRPSGMRISRNQAVIECIDGFLGPQLAKEKRK